MHISDAVIYIKKRQYQYLAYKKLYIVLGTMSSYKYTQTYIINSAFEKKNDSYIIAKNDLIK